MDRASTPASAHEQRRRLAPLDDWLAVGTPALALVAAATVPLPRIIRIGVIAVLAVVVAAQVATGVAVRRRMADRVVTLTRTQAWQSTHDQLTGLPNRAALVDALTARFRGENEPDEAPTALVSLLLIRLDGVDAVRATLGHDQADVLILAVTERLRAAVGAQGILARLDGGELAAVHDPASPDDEPLHAFAARLAETVASPLLLLGGEVVTTASIGVAPAAASSDRSVAALELLRTASVALELARAAGGARIEMYRRDTDEHAVSDLRLAAELRRAVPDHELEVYYQPIVSLPDRRLAGAEALIRWNHPREGVLTPDRWLSVADDAGLMPEIGHATLDEVCRRFATLGRSVGDHPLRIAVNLAPSELRDPALVDSVGRILERSGLRPSQLVVEVSDHAVVDEDAAAAIVALRQLGVRIALDDFGTGLAAIGRLGHLPIDSLKLDDSVVAHAASGGTEAAVLESIIGLCARLGIDVVAEGVSTEHDADALARLGCQYAQGWMFGRPVPFSRFVALLRRMEDGDEPSGAAAPTGAVDEASHAVGDLG